MFRKYAPPIYYTNVHLWQCLTLYGEEKAASSIKKYNWKLIALLLFANVCGGGIFLLKLLFSVRSGEVGEKHLWLELPGKPSNCSYVCDHVSVSLTSALHFELPAGTSNTAVQILAPHFTVFPSHLLEIHLLVTVVCYLFSMVKS